MHIIFYTFIQGMEETMKNQSTFIATHLIDIMKIHEIACTEWKDKIAKEYILKVDPSTLIYNFTQEEIDAMFKATTVQQLPVLESIFGVQSKPIIWENIKTGSKVTIKYSTEHCSGLIDLNDDDELDVVFFGTKHFINGKGEFFNSESEKDYFKYYFTFHKNKEFILFGGNDFDVCKNFIVEVIEY